MSLFGDAIRFSLVLTSFASHSDCVSWGMRHFRKIFACATTPGENGFIPVEKLGEVLNELELKSLAGCDERLQTLQAYLEVGAFVFAVHVDLFIRVSYLLVRSCFCRLLERVSFFGITFGRYAADS